MKDTSKDILTHYVKIDENTELMVKIPAKMTAMEFKAITLKASKLFTASQADAGPLKKHTKYARIRWTTDMLLFVKKNYGKLTITDMVVRLNVEGMTASRVISAIAKMKSNGEINGGKKNAKKSNRKKSKAKR